MRHIIIPDIHLDIDYLQSILDKENMRVGVPDKKLTLLGDIADTRNPNVDKNPNKMMRIISDFSEWDNVEVLPGNHDYFYFEEILASHYEMKQGDPINFLQREGTINGKTAEDVEMYTKAYNNIRKHPRDIFKNVHTTSKVGDENILVTHSGLHDFYFKQNGNNIGLVREAIEAQYNDLFVSNFKARHPMINACGSARNGMALYGGIMWRDDISEPTVAPLNQIYGHTAMEGVAVYTRHMIDDKAYFNLCLDGKQTTYGVIENDCIHIRSVTPDFAFLKHENKKDRFYGHVKEVRIFLDGVISLDI